MAGKGEKPACLIVCSSHSKGVSAQSFLHAFTLTSSTFNVFLATPEGKPVEFVDVEENNQQWVTDFQSKPFSVPQRLANMDSSRFTALLIPSCPGALFDLATNHYLAALLNSFVREKKPMCAVGFGVTGLFSTADKQSKQWNFAEYSLTGPSTFELAKREDFASVPTVPSDFIRKHGATYSVGVTQATGYIYSSLGVLVLHTANTNEPAILQGGIQLLLKNSSKPDNVHVVVDNHLVTGQNIQSTLTAVQNLILISNARLTRSR